MSEVRGLNSRSHSGYSSRPTSAGYRGYAITRNEVKCGCGVGSRYELLSRDFTLAMNFHHSTLKVQWRPAGHH